MPITDQGKRDLFRFGLKDTIEKMRIYGPDGQVGSTNDVSFSMGDTGEITLDSSSEFDVEADDSVDEIRLLNSSDNELWTIDISTYDFEYDGTFTVENISLQISAPSGDYGITDLGRDTLMERGFLDSDWNLQLAGRFEEEDGSDIDTYTTETATDGDDIDFSTNLADGTFNLDHPVQVETNDEDTYLAEIILNGGEGSERDELWTIEVDPRKHYEYPAKVTIETFELSINN